MKIFDFKKATISDVTAAKMTKEQLKLMGLSDAEISICKPEINEKKQPEIKENENTHDTLTPRPELVSGERKSKKR